MQKSTAIQDPHLRRLVHDLDALADVLHHLIDRDAPAGARHEIAERELEFTTEWQMVSTVEEGPSD